MVKLLRVFELEQNVSNLFEKEIAERLLHSNLPFPKGAFPSGTTSKALVAIF